MTMKGANSDSLNVSANVMCEKYISASVMWSQLNLVPHSKLADCGFIVEFALIKAPGAQELLTELTANDSAYYWIWNEASILPLALPSNMVIDLSDDEEDDAEETTT